MNMHVSRVTNVTRYDDGTVVCIVQHAGGDFSAYVKDAPCGSPIGYGLTKFQAECDLLERLPRWEAESDQRADRIAYVRDHERDYRKHGG